MKRLPLILLLCILGVELNAQTPYKPTEFEIGLWSPPSLIVDVAAVPADYNGDGKVDLAIRINSGTNCGKWMIEYSDPITNWNASAFLYCFSESSWDVTVAYTAPLGNKAEIPLPADYDGDGKADISVFSENGDWLIDYAINTFGTMDFAVNLSTYGFMSFPDKFYNPVPADYDGDGKADIAIKSDYGYWFIDYSNNGFGSFDVFAGNSNINNTNYAVPADYDGDGMADISIKTNDGFWLIDYASNGFGSWDSSPSGYGNNQEYRAAPADYDGDGMVDLSVKVSIKTPLVVEETWRIDYANNGFGYWDLIQPGYGLFETAAVSADYDGDGSADIGERMPDGRWLIDYHYNGFGSWGYGSSYEKTDGNYDINDINPDDLLLLNQVKDCNIDIMINPDIMTMSANRRHKEYYLALIDDVGLKTMMSDQRIAGTDATFPTFNSTHANDFLDFLQNLPSNLQDNIHSVYIGDEPDMSQSTNAYAWTDFFQTNYPQRPSYYNLLPYYFTNWNMYSSLSENDKIALYNSYLDLYSNVANASDILSYDHYPVQQPETYFYNLRLIKERANDKPFWATINTRTVIADSPATYAPPSAEALRFMAFSPIAYGAKGLSYWMADGLLSDPIRFDAVKEINRYIKDIVAPVVMNSINIASVHKMDLVNGTSGAFQLTSGELISNYYGIVKDVDKDEVMIGIFQEKSNHDSENCYSFEVGDSQFVYLWVVNKSTSSTLTNVKITLRRDHSNNIRIAPSIDGYNPLSNAYTSMTTTYLSGSNTTEITISQLSPGEGRMIRVTTENESIPTPGDYDGDGITDISIKESNEDWKIDFSKNGFGSWDWIGHGYGNSAAVPVVADYDGDGSDDISVRAFGQYWLIDYANNGFGIWDWSHDYGALDAYACPADYDGDGKADISIKADDQRWLIDYSTIYGFGAWDWTGYGYGNVAAKPVPGDYDNDGYADLAIRAFDQYWLIDYKGNGFGGWDWSHDYGFQAAIATIGDYDGDGYTDISIRGDNEHWLIDYYAQNSGFGSWDWDADGYGDQTATPAVGDYDGDGNADICVKVTDGRWLIDYDKNGTWNCLELNPTTSSFAPNKVKIQEPEMEKQAKYSTVSSLNDYKILSYEVFDMSGRLISTYDNASSLHLDEIPNGVYLLKMKTDNGEINKKISVVR